MINSLNIARYFIVKAYQDGIEAEMTNMKVQKLLYYAQSLYLALYDQPLFEEEIQDWRYGPVCPPAYQYYSEFEANQLPIPDAEIILEIPDDQKSVLEEVWDYFGGYHAYRLSGMTHLEFPWKKARQGLSSEARSTQPILIEDMKALGYQKLDVIERDHPAYEPVMSEVLKDTITSVNNQSEPSTLIHKGEVRDWINSLLD
ncbi:MULTISPECIES: Panacea domain-containing protein [Planktothrix]|uniref:Phage-associated protein n=1 Tax=Planktothrix rubescens CCAP 1459/22 TaxID=329571 RepID=A0A6J7ZTC2_PLARU|nr:MULTISPECIES: type II toxin-antitoxin system antitoxin SocA domain-containing protein [Planktothrix]CAC5345962.1 putative phage-associated protein [Planktothrix rubescens NIVA-CYA 18]CAD5950873.1 Putative prophage protein (Ps3) [Planktothrix rubescens NIVA-CYA 18]